MVSECLVHFWWQRSRRVVGRGRCSCVGGFFARSMMMKDHQVADLVVHYRRIRHECSKYHAKLQKFSVLSTVISDFDQAFDTFEGKICETFMSSLLNADREKVITGMVRSGVFKDMAVEIIDDLIQHNALSDNGQGQQHQANPGYGGQSSYGYTGDQQQSYGGSGGYSIHSSGRLPSCSFSDQYQPSIPGNYHHQSLADCLPPPPTESVFGEDPLPPPPPFVSPVYASGNAMLDGAGGYAMLGGSGGNAMLDGAGGNATIGGAGGNAILGGAGGDWRPRDFIEQALVLYDYEAQKADELNLRKQSVVYILRKNEDGWFEGVDTGGLTGRFPSHYVQPM